MKNMESTSNRNTNNYVDDYRHKMPSIEDSGMIRILVTFKTILSGVLLNLIHTVT